MTKIYHNPRCSKSRATLSLLQEKGLEPEVVLYLENPPDVDTLKSLVQAMDGCTEDIIRSGETIYKELSIDDSNFDEQTILQLIASNPVLLQRPIVVHQKKAAIGRPPENVLNLFA